MTVSSSVSSSLLALGFAGIYYQKDKKRNEKKRKGKLSILLVWQEYDDIL